MSTLLRLLPGQWTPIPDTRYEVRWDGADEITVYWRGDEWDVCSASSPPGYLLARITRDGKPITPPWPIVASLSCLDAHRTRYPSSPPGRP